MSQPIDKDLGSSKTVRTTMQTQHRKSLDDLKALMRSYTTRLKSCKIKSRIIVKYKSFNRKYRRVSACNLP